VEDRGWKIEDGRSRMEVWKIEDRKICPNLLPDGRIGIILAIGLLFPYRRGVKLFSSWASRVLGEAPVGR